jgi:hypothetical protein
LETSSNSSSSRRCCSCACSGDESYNVNRLRRADCFLPNAAKVVTTTDDDDDERAFVSRELGGVVFAPCTAAVTVAAGVLAINLLVVVIERTMIVAVVIAFIVAGLGGAHELDEGWIESIDDRRRSCH